MIYIQSFSPQLSVPIGKNPLANAGDVKDVGLIPELGRSPGGGHGNPLQYSCLKNPMGRGAWRTAIGRVGKGDTTEVTEYAFNQQFPTSSLGHIFLIFL